MKTAISTLALAGALLLSAVGSLPASAQTSPMNDPRAVQYSWGVLISPSDGGPNRSYTWEELGKSGAASGVQSRGLGQTQKASSRAVIVDDPSGRATIVNDPRAVQYSWGVILSSNDGPNRSYTWQELGK